MSPVTSPSQPLQPLPKRSSLVETTLHPAGFDPDETQHNLDDQYELVLQLDEVTPPNAFVFSENLVELEPAAAPSGAVGPSGSATSPIGPASGPSGPASRPAGPASASSRPVPGPSGPASVPLGSATGPIVPASVPLMPASGQSANCTGTASEKQLSTGFENVCSKVRQCRDFWETIGASLFILNLIQFGYKIPFYDTPQKAQFKNNLSARQNSFFVESEIDRLLKFSYIKKVLKPPWVVNPLSVAKNSVGKLRLILDLRHVNKCLFKFGVKYEGLDQLPSLVTEGGFMAKFDLRSGYHHIGIFEDHQDYLGFSWIENGTVNYYKFCVLPFGLSTACSIFVKFLKPLLSKWRSSGIRVLLYLDDGIICNRSDSALKEQLFIVRKDLDSCGLSINEEKSSWTPATIMEWLGVTIDLKDAVYSIPKPKKEKFMLLVSKAFKSTCTTPRLLAVLVGHIVSMRHAIGPLALIRTKYMLMAIREASSWNLVLAVSKEVEEEFEFWSSFFRSELVTWPIFDKAPPTSALALYTDASSTGCGGFVANMADSHFFFEFDQLDRDGSSTLRELKCLQIFLHTCRLPIADKALIWHTDSLNCVRIMEKGSMKKVLQKLRIKILNSCVALNCSIYPIWVPRAGNKVADALSKLEIYNFLKINTNIFAYFNSIWGPYTSDRFFSFSGSPYSAANFEPYAAELFKHDWSPDNNWLIPPVPLIPRTINHMRACRAHGTMVVPKWPSSHFYPLLVNKDGFHPFVIDFVEYATPKNFFYGANKLFSGDLKFNMLVLRLDFS